MKKYLKILCGCILALANAAGWAKADEFSDGITEYTDDAIAADDAIGSNKDTNINFIVVDVLGKAKTAKTDKAKNSGKNSEITNFSDKSLDNNENSVVVESGAQVDKVVNVVVEK